MAGGRRNSYTRLSSLRPRGHSVSAPGLSGSSPALAAGPAGKPPADWRLEATWLAAVATLGGPPRGLGASIRRRKHLALAPGREPKRHSRAKFFAACLVAPSWAAGRIGASRRTTRQESIWLLRFRRRQSGVLYNQEAAASQPLLTSGQRFYCHRNFFSDQARPLEAVEQTGSEEAVPPMLRTGLFGKSIKMRKSINVVCVESKIGLFQRQRTT